MLTTKENDQIENEFKTSIGFVTTLRRSALDHLQYS